MTATVRPQGLPTLYTVHDVADSPEELLDGKIVRPPDAPASHQNHVFDVASALDAHAPSRFVACQRLAVMVDRHNMPFIDVVAIRAEAALVTPVHAVDLVVAVEVLSGWSAGLDRGFKKQLYARAGIPAYWIVDPLGELITVTQFLLAPDGRYHPRLHSADVTTIDQPWPVTLDLPRMTRRRDHFRSAGHPHG